MSQSFECQKFLKGARPLRTSFEKISPRITFFRQQLEVRLRNRLRLCAELNSVELAIDLFIRHHGPHGTDLVGRVSPTHHVTDLKSALHLHVETAGLRTTC